MMPFNDDDDNDQQPQQQQEQQCDVKNDDDREEVVSLNVGGKLFATTRHTLLSTNDTTFFTVLLSGRIPTYKDSSGAIFIDRDPTLFSMILNYLRTRQLFDVTQTNVYALKHEAEYYGITPLVRQLTLYERLVSSPSCGGDILFQSMLQVTPPKEIKQPSPVKQIVSFDNGLIVVYSHHFSCFRLSDNNGWYCIFESGYIEKEITAVDFHFELSEWRFMYAILCEKEIRLWCSRPRDRSTQQLFNHSPKVYELLGCFDLNNCPIDSMFFVGSQLVALSKEKGRVGIRNTARRWFVQDLKQNRPSIITAFDKAETDYLFLCSNIGTIYLIDIQKFPLRMKDGDLLINEFYKDPEGEEITSISCFMCSAQRTEYFPISKKSIEIAYGTNKGTVRILVHHPETVGQGPQLYQTLKVHLSAVSIIMLSNDYLITMCDKKHVRTWSLARFRGLISSQPGATSHSSFQVHCFNLSPVSNDLARIDSVRSSNSCWPEVGPFGDQREGQKQVLVEMPSASAKYVNILYAANGQKICTIRSIDESRITSVSVMYQHDSRYRQFIITGHANGHVQIWDLTTAMDHTPKSNDLSCRSIDHNQLLREIFQSN